MTSPTRKEMLKLLEQVSQLAPDVRFGQLIANLSFMAGGETSDAIWDMEDQQLLDALRQHAADLTKRQTNVA